MQEVQKKKNYAKVIVIIIVIMSIVGVLIGIGVNYRNTTEQISSSSIKISFHKASLSDKTLKTLEKAEEIVQEYWGEDNYTSPGKIEGIKLTPQSYQIRGLFYGDVLYVVNNVAEEDLLPTLVHELIHCQNYDGFEKQIVCKENTPYGVKDSHYTIGWTFNEMTVEAMTSYILEDDFVWDLITEEGALFWNTPLLANNAELIFEAFREGKKDVLNSLIKQTNGEYTVELGNYGNTPYNLSAGDYTLVAFDNYLIDCPIEIYEQLYS